MLLVLHQLQEHGLAGADDDTAVGHPLRKRKKHSEKTSRGGWKSQTPKPLVVNGKWIAFI